MHRPRQPMQHGILAVSAVFSPSHILTLFLRNKQTNHTQPTKAPKKPTTRSQNHTSELLKTNQRHTHTPNPCFSCVQECKSTPICLATLLSESTPSLYSHTEYTPCKLRVTSQSSTLGYTY